MIVLAWENLQEVFVILVVVFTSLEVFYSLLLTSSLNLPWGIAGFLHPFYTFSLVHRRVNRDTFILTFLDFSVSFTVIATVLRGNFLHTGAFYLALLPYIFGTVCDSDVGRNTPSRILFVPALTELSLPADAWSWTNHIVDTRPLVYQLRQWATKYRVKTKLLNMFRLFKVMKDLLRLKYLFNSKQIDNFWIFFSA